MFVPTTPCCISILNQQQEEVIYHYNQCSDPSVTPCKNITRMRTVVENDQVVVKPIKSVSTEQE